MADLGSVVVNVKADTAQLVEGFNRAERTVKNTTENMKKAIAGVATAYLSFETAAIFTKSIKNTIDMADSLNKLSQKVGMSVDSLYALQSAGKLADVSIEEIGKSVLKLNKNLGDISMGGGKDAENALANIGISTKDATGQMKDSNAILLEVSDKFKEMPDGITKSTVAMALFGKSGANLIPLLNSGRDSLTEFTGVMTAETAAAAERLNDSFTRLGLATDAGMTKAFTAALPTVSALTIAMESLAQRGSLIGTFAEDIGIAFKGVTKSIAGGVFAFEAATTTIGGRYEAIKALFSGGGREASQKAIAEADAKLATYKKEYAEFLGKLDAPQTNRFLFEPKKISTTELTDFAAKSETAISSNNKLLEEQVKSLKEINAIKLKSDSLDLEAQKISKAELEYQKEVSKISYDILNVQSEIAALNQKQYPKKSTEKSADDERLKALSMQEQLLQKEALSATNKYESQKSKIQEDALQRYYELSGNYQNEWLIKEKDIRTKWEGVSEDTVNAIVDLEKKAYDKSVAMDEKRLEHASTTADGIEFFFNRASYQVQTDSERVVSAMEAISSATENAFMDMYRGIIKGSLDVKSTISNLLNAVAEELFRIYVVKSLVTGVTNAVGSMFTFNTPAAAPAAAPVMQAKGGAWDGGVQFFAKGGAFTNSVVSTPTMFQHAGGMGVMGEKAPEAIVPLARMSDGGLGIRSIGNGDSGGNVEVRIINQGGQQMQAEKATSRFDMGKQIIEVVLAGIQNNTSALQDTIRAVR